MKTKEKGKNVVVCSDHKAYWHLRHKKRTLVDSLKSAEGKCVSEVVKAGTDISQVS